MKRIYNILYGGIQVPDGKIDTSNFYNQLSPEDCLGYWSDRYKLCMEHVDYESDFIYKEFYDGIEGPEDILWLDLVNKWIKYEYK